jgi:heat-inducible transcriptional repressor
MLAKMNERSREIFKCIVESYMKTGAPIGSRTISRRLQMDLSPATVRNVMADLEETGLLFAPHTSAGRLPTVAGLRLFVDGILELGSLTEQERNSIDIQCVGSPDNFESLLEDATSALSGLAHCASLVTAPKTKSPLRHIEFVNLSPGRALVVMVTEGGIVENRIIHTPPNLLPSALVEATNFLSARLVGRTLDEAYDKILTELEDHRTQLDELTARVVESGLATWSGSGKEDQLIVRGQSHLLEDVTATSELEQIRALFTALETKEEMLRLLSLTDTAGGVQIFIGADNTLFNLAGCSMIVSSYKNSSETILGAIGVIGPTRMNYAHIIPMVDYTSKMISHFLRQQS